VWPDAPQGAGVGQQEAGGAGGRDDDLREGLDLRAGEPANELARAVNAIVRYAAGGTQEDEALAQAIVHHVAYLLVRRHGWLSFESAD